MPVLGMGSNEKAQLGTEHATYAVVIPQPCHALGDPDRIAAGYEASYCVNPSGDVEALGGGGFGQQLDDRYEGKYTRETLHPCIIPPVSALRVYGMHVDALTLDGRVATGGANHMGNLGIGTRALYEERPWEGNSAVAVFPSFPAAFVPAGISPGYTHCLAWSVSGEVMSWGLGKGGALGNGTTQEWSLVPTYTRIEGVTDAAAGGFHSLAVCNGVVYAWGNSGACQCGEDALRVLLPTKVNGLPADVVKVFAGLKRSNALTSDGDLYEWGNGKATAMKILSKVSSVAVSEWHSLAISNGEACTWGANQFGQCGNGTRETGVHTPYHTGIAAKVVASGFNHSLILV